MRASHLARVLFAAALAAIVIAPGSAQTQARHVVGITIDRFRSGGSGAILTFDDPMPMSARVVLGTHR
ncbi:MAG: hypothetical protein ABIS06_02005 [Vicinamibacterales bacterium]